MLAKNTDTAKPYDNSNLVINISLDGDVILVVGPQHVRLRVHSQCLRCASKVFGAMFGPQWMEGEGISYKSPSEVLLLEDDAEALRTICRVIHHRNDDVPQFLTPKAVLQVAIVADKYDLNVALRFANMQGLKPRIDVERVDMGYLMAAAFLSSDVGTFMAHTLSLVLNYNGSYLEFLNDEFTSKIVPLKAFRMS
ncbi:btb/poz-like protein [Rhizodiscina lignyota]|uniref:Btb/poz-like protein n=1 Tax=Rhizodiscina lignyota TaxID=1504668 RepID=A0A9P4I902_9PEZI|nr:btb/poz-like protein [Rhizodiscina lignyota]